MSLEFKLLGAFDGAENMRRDQEKFLTAEQHALKNYFYLGFYTWQNKAISFGYRQKIAELIDLKKAAALGIELVSRPTGGGMVFHQPGELTYCLVAARALFPTGIISSCNAISKIIISGLNKLGLAVELAQQQGVTTCNQNLCFARATKYEVLSQGRKLLGSAQRRGKNVFLQQGSLPLTTLSKEFSQLTNLAPLKKSMITVAEITTKNLNWEVIATQLAAEFRTCFVPLGL